MVPEGFELRRRLGGGSQGELLLAFDQRLDREVALKHMVASSNNPTRDRHLLLAEGQALARLRHPNIAAVFDIHIDSTGRELDVWLVMQFIDGRGLDSWIEGSTPLPMASAIVALHQLALALEHAQMNGVVHRDIKPANVVASSRGFHLVDFGVASLGGNQPGTRVGTRGYMAPEVIERQPATGASDIYSLGVLAFQMLTGSHPYPTSLSSAQAADDATLRAGVPQVSDHNRDVPRRLSKLVGTMMAKDPRRRPPPGKVAGVTRRLLSR